MILGDKFKKVPESIGEALNKRTDLTVMKSLVVLAATCKSLDEFANPKVVVPSSFVESDYVAVAVDRVMSSSFSMVYNAPVWVVANDHC